MATLVEFTVDGDEFPLGALFASLPDVTIELERIVPTTESLFPYVWIRGASPAEVEAAISASAAETLTVVDDLGSRGVLYRAVWRPDVDGIVDAIVSSNVTLLSATGTANQWTFRLRADDHETVSAFRERCRRKGIHIDVTRLQPLALVDARDEDGLTAAQLEALELAYERGYFDEPRRATLEDLAAEVGITRQSLAGRLRRGHRNLLAGLFGFDRPDERLSAGRH
ncbi:helix-turn-helix domain-containing protein [Halopiger aswanensis]|uniref:Bat-like putative sensory protein with GAF and HTH domain n=1 Tax=Halopiger aswanensis TaxID=148449 RepID=A0A3R7GGX9_9EURY|nr:helix-turn-helix domain-containing protein [Halopiger aswanensis]RKD93608.1 bat-like putative sensory protein with GAF and HTH domain [Halopiger aswanensis]